MLDMKISKRHGGPYDRGAADSYYGRPRSPHYYEGATYATKRIVCEPGSNEEYEYNTGFDDNEYEQNFKEWE